MYLTQQLSKNSNTTNKIQNSVKSKIYAKGPNDQRRRTGGDDKSSFALFAHPTRYTQLVNRPDTPYSVGFPLRSPISILPARTGDWKGCKNEIVAKKDVVRAIYNLNCRWKFLKFQLEFCQRISVSLNVVLVKIVKIEYEIYTSGFNYLHRLNWNLNDYPVFINITCDDC